jgi:hypothetical protein
LCYTTYGFDKLYGPEETLRGLKNEIENLGRDLSHASNARTTRGRACIEYMCTMVVDPLDLIYHSQANRELPELKSEKGKDLAVAEACPGNRRRRHHTEFVGRVGNVWFLLAPCWL